MNETFSTISAIQTIDLYVAYQLIYIHLILVTSMYAQVTAPRYRLHLILVTIIALSLAGWSALRAPASQLHPKRLEWFGRLLKSGANNW